MGCCSASSNNLQYKHQMQVLNISQKNLETCTRWAKGACVRRNLKKTSQIAKLKAIKKPSYENGVLTVDATKPLFAQKDIEYLVSFNGKGKDYYWNTRWVDIGDGRLYLGQWKKSRHGNSSSWEGLGTIKFRDNSCYRGQTKNGLFHGRGHMTYPDGDIYHGDYVQGKANGTGVLVNSKGTMYDGQWKDDKYHGKGRETFNFNKGFYDGEFVEGQKTGHGKFSMDGITYEGQFAEG